MNIIITGSIAYDYLMSFPGRFADHILPDQLARISLSFLVDDMRRQWGGCAANIAYNLALLGGRPRVLGAAGQDFGPYRAWLERHGVETDLIHEAQDLFTASFFVNSDQDGTQIASFYTGAMARARALSLRELPGDAGAVDLVTISPNDPQAMVKYVAECRELGIAYLYDPSQQIVRLEGADLARGIEGCDMLVVNEYEFELLRDKTGLSTEEMRLAPARACIVTLGSEGAHIWAGGELHAVPPAPPDVVDEPTGVGDAFRAGLLRGLELGMAWPVAGRVGALAATYTLEQPGPQSHHYTIADFVARYVKTFGQEEQVERLLTP
jgi:adenosine kinase